MGPAIFVGLSLFVAVSQGPGAPETNPQITHQEGLTHPPEDARMQVPAPLIRPAQDTARIPRSAVQRAALAQADLVPGAQRASPPQPGAPDVIRTSAPQEGRHTGGALRAEPSVAIAPAPAFADSPGREAGPAAHGPTRLPSLWSGLQTDQLQASTSGAPSAPGAETGVVRSLATQAAPAPSGPERPPEATSPARTPRTWSGEQTAQLQAAIRGAPSAPRGEAGLPRSLATQAAPVATAPGRLPQIAQAAPRWITGDRVYLRAGPGTGFDTLDLLAEGTALRAHGRFGRWIRAELPGPDGPRHGWIWDRYVSATPPG